jgi:hypothetical protein
VLSFPNFYLSEFLTLKEHRQDTYSIHGVIFYVRSLWNSTFFCNSNWLSPFTVNNVMNIVFTALSLRNIVFLEEDHSLNCPFYQKIFYNATFTLMNDSRNNVFLTDWGSYGSLRVFFRCLHKILLLLTAPPFLKNVIFELWRCGHDTFCYFKTLIFQILQMWCWNSC